MNINTFLEKSAGVFNLAQGLALAPMGVGAK
jgi:hypothetical protein